MSADAENMPKEAGSGSAGLGEDEEHWLYGDENDPNKQEEAAPVDSVDAPAPDSMEETRGNGVMRANPAAEGEDESDSDSDDDDDDVQVTIGDIKTGAPQYTYGVTPVNLNIKSSGRLYGSGTKAGKGVDLDAPGDINGMPALEIDLDSFEDKPWRKPGADLSDYFNYGFNEETWKAYCEKQKRLRMGLEPLPLASTTNRITVQQGRTGNPEKEPEVPPPKMDFPSPPNRFRAGPPPNRRLSGSIEVIGGQLITIARVEGRRRDRGGADENAIQVLGDHPASEFNNNTSSKRPPFIPPGAPPPHLTGPPPPFLPPPPPVNTGPPILHPPGMPLTTPPPGFLPPPGAPPPSLVPLESGPPTYNNRTTAAFGYASNDYANLTYPNIPVSSSWSTLIDNNNKQPSQQQQSHWDYYPRRERDRDRDRERERTRERERDRDRERDHDRERDRSPSSSVYNGDESRYRHRDYSSDKSYDRDYHHRDKVSRDKEDRHKERRHRDKEEGRHKSSRSSSRRRHDSEEVDGHKRHKHKKSKRSKEDKEASEEISQEPEPSEAASSN